VKKLPDRRSQVSQPEVVTGGGHQKKDHEGEESKLLKGKLRRLEKVRLGRKQADEGFLSPKL